MRPRSIRVDDATWARIRAAAQAAGEDVSTYLRRRATEPRMEQNPPRRAAPE
jgi:hypothetical protein